MSRSCFTRIRRALIADYRFVSSLTTSLPSAPRLLGFAIYVWTIPAQIVQFYIAISVAWSHRPRLSRPSEDREGCADLGGTPPGEGADVTGVLGEQDRSCF